MDLGSTQIPFLKLRILIINVYLVYDISDIIKIVDNFLID